MIEWIEGIQNAIEYMEDHLTEELDIRDIAEKAYISPFLFSKNIRRPVRFFRRRVYSKSKAQHGGRGIIEYRCKDYRCCS
jgi:AraC-like DNA-binding protein